MAWKDIKEQRKSGKSSWADVKRSRGIGDGDTSEDGVSRLVGATKINTKDLTKGRATNTSPITVDPKVVIEAKQNRYRVPDATSDPDFEKYSTLGNRKAESGKIKIGPVEIKSGFNRLDNSEDYMQPGEKKIYDYWIGKGDKESATKFLKWLEPEINRRRAFKEDQMMTDITRNSKVAGVAMELTTNLAAPIGYLSTAKDFITGEDIDPNSPAYMAARATNSIENELFRESSEFTKFLGQTGLSMGKFATALPFGQVGALTILSSGAAGSTAWDATNRGASTNEAMMLGTAAGITEYLTEKLPVDNLFRLAKSGVNLVTKEGVKQVLKQAGIEGTEEVVSQYVNTLTDIAVMGSRSNYERYKAELVASGLSIEEAESQAKIDMFIKEPAIAFAGGALSGGVFGAGAGAVSTYNVSKVGSQMRGLGIEQDIVDTGLESGAETGSNQTATKVADIMKAGGKVSNYDIGKLYYENINAVNAENDEAQRKGIESMLRDAGVTEAEPISRVMQKAFSGDPLSNTEAEAIITNETARNMFSSFTGQDIPIGTMSSMRRAVKGFSENVVKGTAQPILIQPNEAQIEPQPDANAKMEQPVAAAPKMNVQPQQTMDRPLSREEIKAQVSKFGQAGAKSYGVNLKDQQDINKYTAGFSAYYIAGKSGLSYDDTMKANSNYDLPDTVKFSAYSAGQNDAKTDTKSKPVYSKEAGLKQTEESKDIKKNVAKVLDSIGKATGVKVVMVKSIDVNGEKAAANGLYMNGVLQIASDAVNPIMVVAKHEVTHRLQETSPEAYKEYKDYVVQVMIKQGTLAENMKKLDILYKKHGKQMSHDKILDEIVANFTEQILTDVNAINDLVQTNRTLAQQILDMLREFMATIKEAIGKVDPSVRNQLGFNYDELKKAEALWVKALKTAEEGENDAAITSEEEMESSYVQYSLVKDKETLDFLENQNQVPVYRAMQVIDGKLYPPMAAKVATDGKRNLVMSSKLNAWEQADERPDLIKNGKFTLDKANGSSIAASYNPYFHTSRSLLNDQFSSAYKRPNIVVVEGLVPESELTSKYHAPYAKDSVGEMDWHSGPVSSKLPEGKKRKVILSRWFKPLRIVPDTEAAQKIATLLDGENIPVPRNVVTPSLLEELDKLGVQIGDQRGLKDAMLSLKDSEGNQLTKEQAEFFKDSKVRDAEGNLLRVYHGTETPGFTVFDSNKFNKNESSGDYVGEGFYFTNNEATAKRYGSKVYPTYLNIQNPVFINTKEDITKFNRMFGVVDSGSEYAVLEQLDRTRGQSRYYDLKKNSPSKIRSFLIESGYDGLVDNLYGQYAVFSPNKIKSVDNLNPTTDPDIRYSLKGESDILKQNAQMKEMNDYLKAQMELTSNVTADRKKTEAYGKSVLREYSSYMDRDEFISELHSIYNDMSQEQVDFDSVMGRARDLSSKVIEQASVLNDDMYKRYKELIDNVRTTPLAVQDVDKKEISYIVGDYNEFRKKNMGTLNLVNPETGGSSVDTYYQELVELYPEFFDEDIVNQGEQLVRIRNVVESLRPYRENPHSDFMDEAAEYLAQDLIDNFFEIPQTRPTFADKQQKRVDKERIKAANQRRDLREKQKARIEQIKSQHRDKTKELIAAEKEKRVGEVVKLKEKFKQKEQTKNQKISDRRLRLRIQRLVKEMNAKLISPTDKHHVPEGLRKPVAEFLKSIDFSTGRQGQGTRNRLANLNLAYSRIAAGMDRGDSEYYLDIDPDLINMISDLQETIGDKRVVDMNSDELMKLWQITRIVRSSINNYNKLLSSGLREEVVFKGESVLEDLRKSKDKTESGYDMIRKIDNMVNLDMVAPADYFEMLGDTMYDLYGNLRRGLDKKVENTKTITDYMQKLLKDQDIKTWTGKKAETTDFTLKSGKKITLTPAQVMSLYLLEKRDQARGHIYGGGIKHAPIVTKKKGKTTITKTFEPARVTPEDVSMIIGNLTAEQKKIADGISEFLNTYTSDWGNEVSMALYGYKKFTEKNYFPIKSDDNYLVSEFGMPNDSTLRSKGFTKALTKGANNPIIIDDIFDVFAKITDDSSSYNAFVLPLSDLQKVVNYKGLTGTVKQAIEKRYGTKGVAYFGKLMQDINGGIRTEVGTELVKTLLSNFKAATMGLNIRVIVQQPTALIRAAAMIDPKYLAAGVVKKGDWKKVTQYSQIAQWKSWGYFSMDIGRQMKDIIMGEKSMRDLAFKWIQDADNMAWGKLWNAVELETKDRHPNLIEGTDMFYEMVAKRFNDIVDRTQVVDTVLHRPQILRSNDTLVKVYTSFMGEPLKSFNMLRTNIKRAAETGSQEDKERAVRTSVAWLSSMITNVLIVSLIDIYRGKGDDEDEFLEKYAKLVGGNALNDAIGMFPFVRDIVSMANGFSPKRMDLEGLNDVANATKRLGKAGASLIKGEPVENTPLYILKDTVSAFSKLLGIPIKNVFREIESASNLVIDGFSAYEVEYALTKSMYNINHSENRGKFVDIMYKAMMEDDMESAKRIYNDMLVNGVSKSYIEYGYKTRQRKTLDGTSEIDLVNDLVQKWNKTPESERTEAMKKDFESQAKAAYESLVEQGYTEEEVTKAVKRLKVPDKTMTMKELLKLYDAAKKDKSKQQEFYEAANRMIDAGYDEEDILAAIEVHKE